MVPWMPGYLSSYVCEGILMADLNTPGSLLPEAVLLPCLWVAMDDLCENLDTLLKTECNGTMIVHDEERMVSLLKCVEKGLMILDNAESLDSYDGLNDQLWQQRVLSKSLELLDSIEMVQGSMKIGSQSDAYAPLCKLRARVALYQMYATGKVANMEIAPRMGRIERSLIGDIVDVMVYHKTRIQVIQRIPHQERDCSLAMVAWCTAGCLFMESRSNCWQTAAVPSPFNYSKLLCSVFCMYKRCMENFDRRVMNENDILTVLKFLWEVASRFNDKGEQLKALNWIHSCYHDTSGLARLHGDSAIQSDLIRLWIDAELTSLGNKVSIDERKGTKVIGDSLETITMQAARMIFPALIICPYELLSKLISLGALDESGSWMLMMACQRFASLVSLKPIGSCCEERTTELQRHLTELLCNSANISENEREALYRCIFKLSGVHEEGKSISDGISEYVSKSVASPIISSSDMLQSLTLSVLSSNSSHGETSSLTIKSLLESCSEEELVHLFQMERVKDVQVGYYDEAAQPDDPWILQFLSQCFIYLEFDNRYAYYGMEKSGNEDTAPYNPSQFYERAALGHISDMVAWVCMLLFKKDASLAHHIFSILEYRGFPWCRLYFGVEFSDYDASYILKTNPKPGTESKRVFGIEHTLLHQALELAALGSIQPSIFKEIVSNEELRKARIGLSKSLTCLFYISTKHELCNIMTCIELIMSEILFSQSFELHGIHSIIVEEGIIDESFLSTSCKAMSVEFGIRCIISGCQEQSHSPSHVHRWTGVLSDFCAYCADMISSTVEDRIVADDRINHTILSLRIFSELISCYNALCPIIPSSGLEASISFFARALVMGIPKSLQFSDSSISSTIKQRAWDICQGIDNLELRTALSATFIS